MWNPDYIFRTTLDAFGRWSAPQRKRFSNVLGGGQVEKCVFTLFLTVIMAFKHVFGLSLPINRFQKFTIFHTLFSSSFYKDVFSSLAFHRKRPLWKFIRSHMIGQQGRGQSGYEVGLFGRKFDHHGLLLPRGPLGPSVSPPTVKLLVCPISWSHWYNLPPLRNSFRLLCNKFKKFQHYCNVLFIY